jgi:cleavage stimulation factor subunit 3
MTARAGVREMRALTEGLLRAEFPKRPDWTSKADRTLVEGWRTYLKWEEGNPLQLEDVNLVHTRVLFAYRKAFSELRFFPEIWCVRPTRCCWCSDRRRYSASAYASHANKPDDALKYLEHGFAANPARSVYSLLVMSI